MNVKLAVIGGDMRQLVMASRLAEEAEVAVCGFDASTPIPECLTRTEEPEDAIRGASAIILPLPASADKLRVTCPCSQKDIYLVSVMSLLQDEQLLLGGMLDKRISTVHTKTFDYYDREELKVLNSVPTAEGAVAIAMDEMDITLHSAKATVLGFGRIGKTLAMMLKALNAEVTVCARKEEDLAFAEALGMRSVPMRSIHEALSASDCIFNTVPAIIIREPLFDYIGKNTVVIDLAARPGGVDFDKARQQGIKVVWALSLPGKASPVTAGEIIKKSVLSILKQEGVL